MYNITVTYNCLSNNLLAIKNDLLYQYFNNKFYIIIVGHRVPPFILSTLCGYLIKSSQPHYETRMVILPVAQR